MNYNYTITETHTNSKSDPSPVILHDAYTDEPVWQDGSDIIFFLENGIAVRPHAEPNNTNRWLRTDGAEVRIRNVTKITVRNGKSFPCVGEQFIILHHKYRPDAGIFQLKLINNQRHGELYYDFACDSVEYLFNEFKGDSWIQQARDQEQEIVRRFLRQGRGEAVRMLRRLDDADRHEHLDSVRYAVTHDLRFDHQCEPKRTQYIFDLLESYQGEDRETLDRAILHDCRKEAPEYDLFALDQYLDVLKRFAESGESAAEEAIRQIYDIIRTAYETRTEIPEPYDELADRYRLISRFIGKPLPDDEEAYPVPHTKTHREEPPVTMQSVIEAARNPEGRVLHPRRFHWYFQEDVTPADLAYLAETAKNEPDPAAKARLYSLFSEADYPGDPAELIALAKEHEPMLHSNYGQAYSTALKLQHALSRLRHPAVRAYGFDLIERALAEEEDSKRFVHGFEHWTANYDESADLDRFCGLLTGLPESFDDDTRHSLEFAITHRMFNRKYEDPRTYGHLVWVYDTTNCSCCRRKAVELLAMHGMLQISLREHCRFDCDPHTRQTAEKAEEYRELYMQRLRHP